MNFMKSKGITFLGFMIAFLISTKNLTFAQNSARIKAFFKGSRLQLSCNYSDINVSWWFDGARLLNNTTIKGSKIVLKIDNVTKKNEGVYYCGSSWQQGENVTVVIGDIPSEPRNVFTSSFEWQETIHWTLSAKNGSLPTCYIVTAQCSSYSPMSDLNCEEHKKNIQYISSDCHMAFHSENRKVKLNLLDPSIPYNVCVWSVNQLGNSSTCLKFIRSVGDSPEKTVPGPPINLTAVEQVPGQVILSWIPRSNWREFNRGEIVIYLYYSKYGDLQNTTIRKPVPASDGGFSINQAVDADTDYTFYAKSQYRLPTGTSVLSAATHVTLHTKDRAPMSPPSDIHCEAIGDAEQRKINVSWKAPRKQDWDIKYIIKLDSLDSAGISINKTVNASVTSAVITVNGSDGIKANVIVCNYVGCSGIGETCIIQEAVKPKLGPSYSKTASIILGCVGAVVIIALIVACLCIRKMRKKKIPQEEDDSSLPDISGPEEYEYAEGDSREQNYARVQPERDEDGVPLIQVV